MTLKRICSFIIAATTLLFLFAIQPCNAQSGIDAERLKALDEYALNAPKFNTIKDLAAYLSKPAKSDLEKTRLIYRWITANISYDTVSFFSGALPESDAQSTFKRGKAVCQGYSELFAELAKLSGLEAAVIEGYAKGYGTAPGAVIDKPNHAWNAVRLGGKWHLIDSTWGAGHIGMNKAFEKNPQIVLEYFFLTQPDEFVFSHLPSDDRWQLTTKTVTKKEFYEYAGLNEYFFIYGIKAISHRKPVIEAAAPVSIQFEAPSGVSLAARLNKNGKDVEGATFVQNEGPLKVVRAAPPRNGEYSLEIFAKRTADGNRFTKTLEYRVVSNTASQEPAYPKAFGTFYDRNVQLKEPFSGIITAGDTVRFSIIAPEAARVAVIDGENWTFLDKKGDVYTGEVTIKSSRPIVSANYSGDNFDTLLEYTAQ